MFRGTCKKTEKNLPEQEPIFCYSFRKKKRPKEINQINHQEPFMLSIKKYP